MNSFRQHIPAFARDGREELPAPIPFETTADLIALDIVQRYKGPTHSHFAMSGSHLMEISDDGYRHWVVGFIEHPEEVDLPQWAGWKHLVRLPDGREVTLTDEVVSSCGGQLTLRDGTIATDVLFERQMAKQAADRRLDEQGICPTCLLRYTHTETEDGKHLRIEDTCPQCKRRSTRWKAKNA